MPSNWSCTFTVQCSNVIFVRELIRHPRGIYSSCGIFHHLGVNVWRVHNTRSPYWKPFNQQTTIEYGLFHAGQNQYERPQTALYVSRVYMHFIFLDFHLYVFLYSYAPNFDGHRQRIKRNIYRHCAITIILWYSYAMFKIFHEKLECMTHSFGRSMMQDMVSCMVWVIRRPRPAFFISVNYPHVCLHQCIIWAVLPMACEHPTVIIDEPINLS